MSSKRAQRRRHWQHHCGRKHRFVTLEAAKVAAIMLFKQKGDACRAYPCQYCGGFHIGHARAAGA